jgi:hypothetical protein
VVLYDYEPPWSPPPQNANHPVAFLSVEAGLRRAAIDAPNRVMREIAILALGQEHTLGTLARALNERLPGERQKSNVRLLFKSKNPRPEIIEKLAEIVGMGSRHRRAATQKLRPGEEDEAITAAVNELVTAAAFFAPGVVDDVKRILATVGGELRTRAASAFLLGEIHARADIEDPLLIEKHFVALSTLGERLAAFLLALAPEFDLERALATGARPLGHLLHLYEMLRNWGLMPSEADTVVSMVESFFLNHGVEPARLAKEREHLQRNRTRADKRAAALHRIWAARHTQPKERQGD